MKRRSSQQRSQGRLMVGLWTAAPWLRDLRRRGDQNRYVTDQVESLHMQRLQSEQEQQRWRQPPLQQRTQRHRVATRAVSTGARCSSCAATVARTQAKPSAGQRVATCCACHALTAGSLLRRLFEKNEPKYDTPALSPPFRCPPAALPLPSRCPSAETRRLHVCDLMCFTVLQNAKKTKPATGTPRWGGVLVGNIML